MTAEFSLHKADIIGCPSGLSPSPDDMFHDKDEVVDPAPFVRKNNGTHYLELAVFGAKCAGCIAKIEKAMSDFDGIDEARLNLSTGRLSLTWRETDQWFPSALTQKLHQLGFRARPYDPKDIQSDHDKQGRALLLALGVAGFGAANVMLLSVSVWSGGADMGEGTRGLMHWASALIAIPAALYAGRPFFSSAWGALKNRSANMDVPISLAVLLSLSISIYEFFAGGEHAYFDAAVMLLFFLLIGRYLDHRLRWRAKAAARNLLSMQRTTVQRMDANNVLSSISSKEVKIGDHLLLSPGDRAPVNGIIIEGASYTDRSMVTGESTPEKLRIDDEIHAGVVNVSDRLMMKATATVENSLIADLARLIETGEQSRSRYIRLADRAARLYVPVVHSLALVTLIGWLIAGVGLREAILNAVAVLIITCPCALGLAAPAVQIVATGRLFKRGILVKSGDALERLAETTRMIFDKTGTLTLGKPTLINKDEIARPDIELAASLARISRHPISRAIVETVGPGHITRSAVEFPGLGIEAKVDGETLRLGSADWVGAEQSDGSSMVCWFRRGEQSPILLQFEDVPHHDAKGTIAALQRRGLDVELLSGDHEAAVETVARDLSFANVAACISPQEKASHLANLANQGAKVAMVGDGLNDAPSLANAHVSLSPGSAADVSQASADFVYLGKGLSPIVEAVDISRAARRRMLENFGFAAFYNLCAIPLAVFGIVTPLIAALAMSGSSIVVTLNALRLAGHGSKENGTLT